ncbi:hypothetical protein AAG607_12030 [Citromicrobium bathyomarinum]|uniref:hypothetical protein n=1 Tax=Citromicrobium bathyomarinum TaxID=72174 RepID=UPI00315A56FF
MINIRIGGPRPRREERGHHLHGGGAVIRFLALACLALIAFIAGECLIDRWR